MGTVRIIVHKNCVEAYGNILSWMKEEKGIIHRGRGAHLHCPVSTAEVVRQKGHSIIAGG
jgi:hypothetical protein